MYASCPNTALDAFFSKTTCDAAPPPPHPHLPSRTARPSAGPTHPPRFCWRGTHPVTGGPGPVTNFPIHSIVFSPKDKSSIMDVSLPPPLLPPPAVCTPPPSSVFPLSPPPNHPPAAPPSAPPAQIDNQQERDVVSISTRMCASLRSGMDERMIPRPRAVLSAGMPMWYGCRAP